MPSRIKSLPVLSPEDFQVDIIESAVTLNIYEEKLAKFGLVLPQKFIDL